MGLTGEEGAAGPFRDASVRKEGMMTAQQEILEFWFEEISPQEQFMGGPELDDRIRTRFGAIWDQAVSGQFREWLKTPDGALALIILLDQFPRNMFRGSGKSFDSDALARECSAIAIESGHDMTMPERKRLFIYMPYMHSEDMEEQRRCVELIHDRMPETGALNLLHARAHRDIIGLFGRFPYRNEALGRESTDEETAWMETVGYRKFVEQLEAADKA